MAGAAAAISVVGSVVSVAQGIKSLTAKPPKPAPVPQAPAAAPAPLREEPKTAEAISQAQQAETQKRKFAVGRQSTILTSGQGVRNPLGAGSSSDANGRTASVLG